MTDKEKLDAIRAEVEEYISAARKAHTNITEGNFAHLLSFIDSLQEEPVSDFEMALTEMIDKAQKCVVEPWAVAAQWKDYLIELAKSEEPVGKKNLSNVERIGKNWKEEPISEDFEKIVEEIAEPTILNAYGTKELARRLRNTICGTSVSEDLELTCKDIEKICLIAKESHKFYGFWSEIVYDDILKRFKKLREEKL